MGTHQIHALWEVPWAAPVIAATTTDAQISRFQRDAAGISATASAGHR